MNIFADESVSRERSVLDRIQNFLFPGEFDVEGSGYERHLFDTRIEKYLDSHFDEYIEEYGLVRELELEVYDSKYENLLEDIDEIEEFQMDVQYELESMDKRLDKLEDKV